ncbi:MAG TPA: YfcE family phosphodiesterase [Chitinophagaceae bacterium]|nr:YfcE family phosphodiesterase [Chitinophagaceae bacterium]
MRLVFISDIHANLPALEAVWKDIQTRRPDAVFCLGDLVNFAGWDNEVIEFIRNRNIICIQGNHDEGIGNGYTKFSYSYSTETQKEFGIRSIARVNENIDTSDRNFLQTLPGYINMEFQLEFQKLKLTMAHGTITSNNKYILPDTDSEKLLAIINESHSDIFVNGHTHRPFHRAVVYEEGNRKLYKHFINAGSVGKPKHGNNHACYVLLELKKNLRPENAMAILPEFHYVPYDVSRVLKKLHDAGMGDAYDDFLLKGSN